MVYTSTEAEKAGRPERQGAPALQRRLQGLKKIGEYAGYSNSTIKKLVRLEGFPASKAGGGWVSDADQIDAWFASRARGQA